MNIREKINNAAMELKIALFCLILVGLSFVYSKVNPSIGSLIYSFSILTFIESLLIFFYKLIFGKMSSLLVIIMFLSIYVAGGGLILKEGLIVQLSILAMLLAIVIKAFIWIFIKKKPSDQTSEEDVEEKNKK